MRRWAGIAIAIAWTLTGRARASVGQESGFERRLEVARQELVGRLEGYTAWCQTKNLFNERRRACELLLELVPDHPEARKTLGFTREKGGGWKAPEKEKSFRDFDKKALEEAPGRWKEAVEGYLAAMTGLLEGGALTAEQRERAGREALRFAPNDARVHELLGEVRGEAGWVLPETLRAKAQRAVLRDHVASALEGAPAAVPVPLNERERKFPLHLEAVASARLRVVGTASVEELTLCAQAVQALEYLAQQVLASKYFLPPDTTVFLLSDPLHLPKFLEHHPSVRPEDRAYYQSLEGGGIAGTADFAFWTGDTQRRIDGIVRLVLGYWLSGAYQIHADIGWVYEGLGLYLTRSLVRTRLTWLAQPSKVLEPTQDIALRQKLIDPETNWMDEALRLLQEERAPALGELVSKGASDLTTEDVLFAYALATYLLEAQAERVPRMLEHIGNGLAKSQAFQEAVNMDIAAFQRHFRRWLEERK
jgi:hypothetical protein